MCPGMSFGLANVELALASLLYHFDWKLPDNAKPEDIDISESVGLTARRKTPLLLNAVRLSGA
jgi:cytochrome P450